MGSFRLLRGYAAASFAAAAMLVAFVPVCARAACNTIPLHAPGVSYYGWLGTVNRPFASPRETLQVARRPCDAGDPFPTSPLPRTLVATGMGRSAEILILEPDAVGCSTATVKQCEQDLAAKGLSATVRCAALPTTSYGVDAASGALALTVPDEKQLGFAPATGALALAVTSQSVSPPCALLLRQDCKRISGSSAVGWSACIDRLYAADPACSHADLDPTFTTVTLLPPWNDFRALCFTDTKYCAENAPRLRYTIDAEGNLVVPVDWQSLLRKCPGWPNKKCGFEVGGDLVAPRGVGFSAPGNDPNDPGKNTFLESFSADGIGREPYFVTRASIPGGAGFMGKADEAFSVLRLRQERGECYAGNTPTGKRCSGRRKSCAAGTACERVCVEGSKPGARCQPGAGCGAGGRCGLSHALETTHKSGRWWLDRDDGAFCRLPDVPTRPCSGGNVCSDACVRYQATARNPFDLPVTTEDKIAPAPGDATGARADAVTKALRELVPSGASVIAEAISLDGAWAAQLVTSSEGTAGGSLVVGSTVCPDGKPVCSTLVLPLERRPLGLAFHGDQLRYLLDTAPGGGTLGAAASVPAMADLMVLDPTRQTDPSRPRATYVSRVVLGEDRYDPLGAQPNGATLLLTPAGRCYRDDTLLSVPSYCRPSEPGDCPSGTECRAELIAVAVDLRADDDADGVPDVVGRSVR